MKAVSRSGSFGLILTTSCPHARFITCSPLGLFKQLLRSSLGEGKDQMEAQENKPFVKVLVKFPTGSPTPPLDLRKGPLKILLSTSGDHFFHPSLTVSSSKAGYLRDAAPLGSPAPTDFPAGAAGSSCQILSSPSTVLLCSALEVENGEKPCISISFFLN